MAASSFFWGLATGYILENISDNVVGPCFHTKDCLKAWHEELP